MYCLILKSTNEIVGRISSTSLEQARLFFMGRKKMNQKNFNKIYEVKIDDIKKK
tara:strand:+ start:320 stop:481 length:162 start_codon:yes stop_codon:yes gene_type:complete